MKFKNFYINFIFILLGISFQGHCDTSSLIWKSTYYNPLPNKIGISQAYCEQHVPGIFIGKVSEQLKNGAITNRNIRLSNFTFHQNNKDGVYFMYGTLLATGITNGSSWQDQIKYLVYKLTDAGKTYGVWTTPDCKGLYEGEVVIN